MGGNDLGATVSATGRKRSNVRRSLQKAVKDRIETPNTTPSGLALASGFVEYGDEEFDNSGHERWVRFEHVGPVEGGAGAWGRDLWQFTCFSRHASDRVGQLLDQLVDVVIEAMRQSRGEVDHYDWSTPASPVELSGEKVLLHSPATGKRGEPSDGPTEVPAPAGVMARVITYSVGVFPDDWTSEPYRAP